MTGHSCSQVMVPVLCAKNRPLTKIALLSDYFVILSVLSLIRYVYQQ